MYPWELDRNLKPVLGVTKKTRTSTFTFYLMATICNTLGYNMESETNKEKKKSRYKLC